MDFYWYAMSITSLRLLAKTRIYYFFLRRAHNHIQHALLVHVAKHWIDPVTSR